MHYAHMSSSGASFIKIRYIDHLSLLICEHNIYLRPKSICLLYYKFIFLICEDLQLYDPYALACNNILMCKDIKIIIFISFIFHHTSRNIGGSHSNENIIQRISYEMNDASELMDELEIYIYIYIYISKLICNISRSF